jgi:hypothetical protein
MLLPNRIPGTSPAYDVDGRLLGGLDALGDLAAAMMAEADPEVAEEDLEIDADEPVEPVEEKTFPVSKQNRKRRSFASDSDSERGSITLHEETRHEMTFTVDNENGTSNELVSHKSGGVSPASSIENLVDRLSLVVPGSPSGGRRSSLAQFNAATPPIAVMSKAGSVIGPPIDPEAIIDEDSDSESDELLSPGDMLKQRFLELNFLSTLVVSQI